jgi:hypothetical protein
MFGNGHSAFDTDPHTGLGRFRLAKDLAEEAHIDTFPEVANAE